jgi:hypothetical protein
VVLTEREKCLELLEAVKAARGETHQIYTRLRDYYVTEDTYRFARYADLVDALIDESVEYGEDLYH